MEILAAMECKGMQGNLLGSRAKLLELARACKREL